MMPDAFYVLCRSLAMDADKLYRRQLSPVLYLFGAKDGHSWDQVRLAREKPRFWDMVIMIHIPRNLDVGHLERWFAEQLQSEPIMPVADRFAHYA